MRRALIVLLAVIASTALGGTNKWTTAGPSGGYVSNLSVDPADSNVMYARTAAGIYRTSDGGAIWTPASEGLPEPNTSAFVVAAGQPVTLYAGIHGSVWASVDRGEHWSRRGDLGNVYIGQLAYDARSGTLFAQVYPSLLWSRDGGATWKSVKLTAGSVNNVRVSSNAVYAVLDGSPNLIAERSQDGGQTWKSVSGPSPQIFARPDSAKVYCAVASTIYESSDDANSWTKLPALQESSFYSIVPLDSELYVSATSGLLQLDREAQKWTVLSVSGQLRNLAVTPTSPRRFYATPQPGVSQLIDDYWTSVSEGLPGAVAYDIGMSPGVPATVFACTDVGLFLTLNAGESWARSSSLDRCSNVVVSADSPDTAYANPSYSSPVWKTSDRGTTWKQLNVTNASRLAIAESNPAKLYASLANGMAKSSDAGSSWAMINAGLSFDYYDYYGFTTSAIAVSPTEDSNVVIAKYSGVYATNDSGDSWQHRSAEPSVAALTFDHSLIYGGRAKGGAIVSGDGGTTWNPIGLIDKNVTALATSSSTLYAGTSDGHIYRTTNGGAVWNGIYEGLSRGSVTRVAIDESGHHLYASTAAGIYQMDLVDQDIGAERIDVGAFPQSLDAYVENAALVIPVAGKVQGVNALFTTELTLTNGRNVPQGVVVIWLPEGSGVPTVFRASLQPNETRLWDANDQLGIDGIGSLAVVAVDDAGRPVADGSIGGSANIWRHPADGRAPLQQPVSAATGALLAPHGHATLDGVIQDAHTRVNAGIVNLSGEMHQFTVANTTFAVPARSLVQFSLPDGDLNFIEAFAESKDVRWIVYASAIDRSTGEARTVLGQPAD